MAQGRISRLRDRVKAQLGAQQAVLVSMQEELNTAKDAPVLPPDEMAALDELDAMFPEVKTEITN